MGQLYSRPDSSLVYEYLSDGVRTNWKYLRSDKTFIFFLISSLCGTSALVSKDYLSRKNLNLGKDSTSYLVKKKNKSQKEEEAKEKKLFWIRLISLLKIAIPSPFSHEARLLYAQFFLLVMRALMTIKLTKINVQLLTIAIAKASWKFWNRWLFNFFGWMIIAMGVNSSLKFVEKHIMLSIRKRLTLKAHKLYLSNTNLYKHVVLNTSSDPSTRIDQINHRITNDIKEFSYKAAHFYGHSFKPVLEFTLSLSEAIKDIGVIRPFALFFVTGIIGIIVTQFSPKLSVMVAKEQRLEGEFQHAHARVETYAEEISFLNGVDAERGILDSIFQRNISTRCWHSLVMMKKSALDHFLKFQGLLWGGVFIHIPFIEMHGLGEAERISRFRAAESVMLRCGSAFTEIMLLQKKLQELAGYTHRIGSMFEVLELKNITAKEDRIETEAVIGFKNVTIKVPGEDRILLSNLTLQVTEGENLIVIGPNGAGKSSLFRVLAGLWPMESGVIHCPYSGLMWLPQSPYLVSGSLRDQVTYPHLLGKEPRPQDIRIMECLDMAGLGNLTNSDINSLSKVYDEWNDILSGGERQRIGFARLYFHQPKFAVLDEATSAINDDIEATLYKNVINCGTTIISIAHRLSLRQFHNTQLEFEGNNFGNYNISKIPHNQ